MIVFSKQDEAGAGRDKPQSGVASSHGQ